MNTIQRYVIAETVKIFFVTVAATLVLLTLGGGAKEGIRQGLPPCLVFQTMPYIVPEMLRFTIPGCLLFAVCSVFGRMTTSNEIVAVKSMGVNPLVLVWPVLAVAYVLSIATFGIYDLCAVWARPGLRRLIAESVDDIAYGVLRTKGSFAGHRLSMVVKGVLGDRLLQPVITIEGRGNVPAVTLMAKEARLQTSPTGSMLQIECHDGQVDVQGRGSLSFPDRFVHNVLLRESAQDPEEQLSPAALASPAVLRQIIHEKRAIAALAPPSPRSTNTDDGQDDEEQATRAKELAGRQARLFRLQAEIPRRLSNGFGCLCFALVGVPIAMRSRSSDTMSIFFACFLPILLVYYPLLVVGENVARAGVFPQFSVWLADAVLAVAGIALLLQVVRR
jgi:lipopolysaccharide export system permease protein